MLTKDEVRLIIRSLSAIAVVCLLAIIIATFVGRPSRQFLPGPSPSEVVSPGPINGVFGGDISGWEYQITISNGAIDGLCTAVGDNTPYVVKGTVTKVGQAVLTVVNGNMVWKGKLTSFTDGNLTGELVDSYNNKVQLSGNHLPSNAALTAYRSWLGPLLGRYNGSFVTSAGMRGKIAVTLALSDDLSLGDNPAVDVQGKIYLSGDRAGRDIAGGVGPGGQADLHFSDTGAEYWAGLPKYPKGEHVMGMIAVSNNGYPRETWQGQLTKHGKSMVGFLSGTAGNVAPLGKQAYSITLHLTSK